MVSEVGTRTNNLSAITAYGTSRLTGVPPYALYGTLNVTSSKERPSPVALGVHEKPVNSGREMGAVSDLDSDEIVVEKPTDLS